MKVKLPAWFTAKVGPLPGGAWLLVGGIGAVAWYKRRRAAGAAQPASVGTEGQGDALGLPSTSGDSSLPFGTGPPVYNAPYTQAGSPPIVPVPAVSAAQPLAGRRPSVAFKYSPTGAVIGRAITHGRPPSPKGKGRCRCPAGTRCDPNVFGRCVKA